MRRCVLEVARTANGYLIRVEGYATLQQSPALSAFVSQSFAAAPQSSITVDLRACEYLDSTFLGCLLRLHRRAASGELLIAVDETARRRLLAASRLDAVLRLSETVPAALGHFVALDLRQLGDDEFGQHVADSHGALAELPGDHARLFRDIADRLARELQNRPGCA